MRLTKKNQLLLTRTAAAIIALYGTVGVSHAQEANGSAAPAANSDSGTVEKVIVTARRREETLQDVPVSVTAFSADQLAKQAVPDLVGLTNQLPNTTLKASRATNTTLTAFIRGVGQADPVAGYESGVGIYMDDVFLARPQAAVADIYDVERIEVLRGPQGTLYGRNTIGGAIKYVTRKLAPETDVRLKAVVGNYGEKDGILTASTPLSDTARIGGTIAKFKHDGYGKNLTTGLDNYDKDLTAGRLSAEFTPTQNLFIRLAGDVTKDNSDPKNGHRLTVANKSKTPILDNVYDTQAEMIRTNGQKQEINAHGLSALVQYDLNNELTFKSITASRQDKSIAPIDFDALPVIDLEVPAIYKNRQFSQEFNLTYTGPQLQGVAGVYYMDAKAFNEFDTIVGFPAFNATTYTSADVGTKAWAVYADGSYNLTPDLQLSLGGRYTVDKREATLFRQSYLGTGSPNLGNPAATKLTAVPDTNLTPSDLSRRDTKFTPRAAIGYKLNSDHNVYASYSEGFKGGGFDPRMNMVGTKLTLAQAKRGYSPETIKTTELGLKSAFNGGRITTNVAVFHSDYKDVQIPGSIAIDSNGDGKDDTFAGVTTNAGKATIKGVELEAIAHLTREFTVSGMYSYIDAEYKEFIVAGANVANQRYFQNTPRNSSNIRANYDIETPMFGYNGTTSIAASYAFKGKTYQFEYASTLDQDPYHLVDADLVWTRKDGKLRVGLHGKNLNNARYKTAGYWFPTLGNEGTVTAFYGNPRTYQLTVDYRF